MIFLILQTLLKNLHVSVKGKTLSLVDVIFTNRPKYCSNTCNFGTGISDVHNLIAFQFKVEIPPKVKTTKFYRSFKNLDSEHFLRGSEQSDVGNL